MNFQVSYGDSIREYFFSREAAEAFARGKSYSYDNVKINGEKYNR